MSNPVGNPNCVHLVVELVKSPDRGAVGSQVNDSNGSLIHADVQFLDMSDPQNAVAELAEVLQHATQDSVDGPHVTSCVVPVAVVGSQEGVDPVAQEICIYLSFDSPQASCPPKLRVVLSQRCRVLADRVVAVVPAMAGMGQAFTPGTFELALSVQLPLEEGAAWLVVLPAHEGVDPPAQASTNWDGIQQGEFEQASGMLPAGFLQGKAPLATVPLLVAGSGAMQGELQAYFRDLLYERAPQVTGEAGSCSARSYCLVYTQQFSPLASDLADCLDCPAKVSDRTVSDVLALLFGAGMWECAARTLQALLGAGFELQGLQLPLQVLSSGGLSAQHVHRLAMSIVEDSDDDDNSSSDEFASSCSAPAGNEPSSEILRIVAALPRPIEPPLLPPGPPAAPVRSPKGAQELRMRAMERSRTWAGKPTPAGAGAGAGAFGSMSTMGLAGAVLAAPLTVLWPGLMAMPLFMVPALLLVLLATLLAAWSSVQTKQKGKGVPDPPCWQATGGGLYQPYLPPASSADGSYQPHQPYLPPVSSVGNLDGPWAQYHQGSGKSNWLL